MLLLLKSFAMVSLPVLAAIFWKRRTRIPWTGAYAALAAATIFALLKIPISEYIRPLPFLSLKDPNDLQQLAIHSTTISLIYGTTRESVRWLIMRHPAARMTTWQAGILFGLTYTAATAAFSLLQVLYWHAAIAAYNLGAITNQDPYITPFQILSSLTDAPLKLILAEINADFPPFTMLAYFLRWGIVPTALNIGTSLAILYSVHQRKAWPYFAAIACYAAVDGLQLFLRYILTYRKIVEFIHSYELLSEITSWFNDQVLAFILFGFNPLNYIIPILPPLALALLIYLRRALIQTQSDNTP